ncbi:hypothetical protein BJV78DRAFT_633437 [Lactifluus subvellereus]|nr:hypothetical protein BJV78DRAFT_633437 [Lactifluus subvellereus]
MECSELKDVWRKLQLDRLAFRHTCGMLGKVGLVVGIFSGLFLIETHFDANPVLCDDLCFQGLFNRTRRQPAVQTKDEPSNTTPASAGPSSSVLLSFPPPQAPLSSNIVHTHPLSYTSPHPTSMIYPSLHPPPYFFPPHPMRPPLQYHHPTSNVIGTSSHFYDNPHLMQTQN